MKFIDFRRGGREHKIINDSVFKGLSHIKTTTVKNKKTNFFSSAMYNKRGFEYKRKSGWWRNDLGYLYTFISYRHLSNSILVISEFQIWEKEFINRYNSSFSNVVNDKPNSNIVNQSSTIIRYPMITYLSNNYKLSYQLIPSKVKNNQFSYIFSKENIKTIISRTIKNTNYLSTNIRYLNLNGNICSNIFYENNSITKTTYIYYETYLTSKRIKYDFKDGNYLKSSKKTFIHYYVFDNHEKFKSDFKTNNKINTSVNYIYIENKKIVEEVSFDRKGNTYITKYSYYN